MMTGNQRPNPYLASASYALTAFDPEQSDSFPFPVRREEFQFDLTSLPHLAAGPVNIMNLASPVPDRMWAMSTDRVAYVDTSNGQWSALAEIDLPGVTRIPRSALDQLAGTVLESVEHAEELAHRLFGEHPETRTSNGLYTVSDVDNVVYVNAGTVICAIGLRDPDDPSAGLAVLRSVDAATIFAPYEFPGYPAAVRLIGMNMTYDGHLVIGGFGGIAVIDRNFEHDPVTYEFTAGELLSNSFSVDEHGGIYVATGSLAPNQPGTMRKVMWTGSGISDREADGAWSSPYGGGNWAPAVKVGTGTGSTPTLMGFEDDEDHLVVITDGRDRMNLVAFWRNQIPDGFTRKLGTLSDRIADQIAVTAGLDPSTPWIQSEQSVATCGWGAIVVNNVTSEGQADRLVDVMASGPVTAPAFGVERFAWDPAQHRWHSVWTRSDLASISMAPVVSTSSHVACINTYSAQDGWEVTGLDWDTGDTVHRSIFGHATAGNGAYALVQILPDGDMLFNSIAGPVRVPLSTAESAGEDPASRHRHDLVPRSTHAGEPVSRA